MRYSYEFKKKCVELYRQGQYPDTPDGVSTRKFHNYIRMWYQLEELHGHEILKHTGTNLKWSPEDKYKLVAMVLAGKSIGQVSLESGVASGTLCSWVNKYKLYGYNGLVNQKKGRKSKGKTMAKKKDTRPKKLTESEREELIRLRFENEYIKAENAVIKKEIALREKRCAAQLKAKKQRLQKNSAKKDTN